ncbi:hypothetical protein Athai_15430 [Actinocatenispora thailandica]|uniref:Uncharacterized protein n=1 Tax=Actinocatenispora thailandica TaxID=227318 RepID=A0A7R7DM35_9ACTN|nr:DUF5994 family protein [Actinocatenispora thailandica]BCJ34040.1 hypothetical protein Athai_15430 [Actinocatenispora thailandica]
MSNVRLALSPMHSGESGGAWWPNSHQPGWELPEILTVLGRLRWVRLSWDDWSVHPSVIELADGEIPLGWNHGILAHRALFCRSSDYLMLTVIPPETAPQRARALLAEAAGFPAASR